MKIYTQTEVKQLRAFNQSNAGSKYLVQDKAKSKLLIIDNQHGKGCNVTTRSPFFKGFISPVDSSTALKLSNNVQARNSVIAELEKNPLTSYANPIVYLNIDSFIEKDKQKRPFIVDMEGHGVAEVQALMSPQVPIQFVLIGVSAKSVTHSQAFYEYINAGVRYKQHTLVNLCKKIIKG